MLSVWTIATSLVLNAATVSPSSLPARGEAEALVIVDRPAMVHLTATSKRGTRCERRSTARTLRVIGGRGK